MPLVLLALMPPMALDIPMIAERWFIWLVLLSAAIVIYSAIFFKINSYIKVLSIYLFISCFSSTAIYYSYIAYILFTFCLIFYILCLKYLDWITFKKTLLTIFTLNMILLIMQFLNKDSLLNFGLNSTRCWGIVGNEMYLSGLMITIISFFIATLNPLTHKRKYYLVCLGIIAFTIIQQFIRRDVWHVFPQVRGQIWLESIRLSLYSYSTAILGWGMGTFKITFPQIAHLPMETTREGLCNNPHNFFIKVLFETGAIGFIIIISYLTNLYIRLIEHKLFFCVIGLSFLTLNMAYHGQDASNSTVLIIIAFMAFLEHKIKEII